MRLRLMLAALVVAGAVLAWQLSRASGTGLDLPLFDFVEYWAAGHLNKSREVTRSGPYRYVAHPLYLGSALIGAGLAVGSGSAIVFGIVVVYLVVTLTAAIKSEERFLRGKFGPAYDEYRVRHVVDRDREFSWSQAIANREYRAVAGVVVALLLLVWKATYNGLF